MALLIAGKIPLYSCNLSERGADMTVSIAKKRVEIALPISTLEMIEEVAERQGLSVRGFIAQSAYLMALKDKQANAWLNQSVSLHPDSAQAFVQAWDQPEPDNERVLRAKQLAKKMAVSPAPGEDFFK